MSVTVDDEPLAADALGLDTVGQVLTHTQRSGRLVVGLLIDGRPPDLTQMAAVRRSSVRGRTLFVETAAPRQMALDVLADVAAEVAAAEGFRAAAADLLGRDQLARAMEKLGGCLTAWQSAHAAVAQTAKLLHVDLDRLTLGTATSAAAAADPAAAAAGRDRPGDIHDGSDDADGGLPDARAAAHLTADHASYQAADHAADGNVAPAADTAGAVLAAFVGQLRQVRQTLVDRDYVLLADLLVYDLADAAPRWAGLLAAMRATVGA